MSKGHAALGLYTVLAEKGILSSEQLSTFCQPGSDLEGHPNRRIPGVEAATGSLGHGAPMSVGMALALKMKASPARVFCIVGDSENEEGSVFEAMHLAARFKLDNLTWIIDNNRTSPNRLDGERHTTSLAAKYQAFGWFVSEVDGHDHKALRNALAPTGGDRPYVLIANTVKGKGVPAMENNPAWHRRSPTPQELPNLLA